MGMFRQCLCSQIGDVKTLAMIRHGPRSDIEYVQALGTISHWVCSVTDWEKTFLTNILSLKSIKPN